MPTNILIMMWEIGNILPILTVSSKVTGRAVTFLQRSVEYKRGHFHWQVYFRAHVKKKSTAMTPGTANKQTPLCSDVRRETAWTNGCGGWKGEAWCREQRTAFIMPRQEKGRIDAEKFQRHFGTISWAFQKIANTTHLLSSSQLGVESQKKISDRHQS